MIQDILPFVFHNEYKTEKPGTNSYVILAKDRKVLVKRNQREVSFPKYTEVQEYGLEPIYLFSVDTYSFYTLDTAGEDAEKLEEAAEQKILAQGGSYLEAGRFRELSPKWCGFAMITAFQLIRWYRSNRFCGTCGSRLKIGTTERSLCCPKCGSIIYPKISPAVIAAVIYEDRILLTKYAAAGPNGRYALVAGFTEIGETLEETVRREVHEETGVRVKNIRYYKSQPWSQSDTMMIGFFCELDGPEELKLDENELSTAVWAEREEIPTDGKDISLTYEMMALFKEKGRDVL